MKKPQITLLLLFILVLNSCEDEKSKSDTPVNFDFYSLTLFQQDDSQLYFRLGNINDSLFVLYDKGNVRNFESKIFLTESQANNFRDVTMKNVSINSDSINSETVFGGVSAKFNLAKNNVMYSANYKNLEGFYSISESFNEYLSSLKELIPELQNSDNRVQIDSLKSLID